MAAAIIVVIGVALLAVTGALLGWPFMGRCRESVKFLGWASVLAILGTAVWWMVTYENPPAELFYVGMVGGGAYIVALMLRFLSVSEARPGSAQRSLTATTGLIKKRGETILASFDGATIQGLKKFRAHLGFGTRLFGRVYGGAGLSIPFEHLSPEDKGALFVTNLRVVFTGQKRTYSMPVRTILEAEFDGRFVAVRPHSGKVFVFDVHHGEAVYSAIQLALDLAE